MKPFFILLACAALLFGCKSEPTPRQPPLDPNARITLNGAAPIGKVAPVAPPYSIETVVRYAMMYGYIATDGTSRENAFSAERRDLTTNKLFIGFTDDVVRINQEGKPELGYMVDGSVRDFVLTVMYRKDKPNEWYDIMADNTGVELTNPRRDTLAYIPNHVMIDAERQVKIAFDKGDYAECHRLFDEAFVFVPITGPEWRALKAKNEH